MPPPRRVPNGEKLAPNAVVGRVSLYLRQLETLQRQGVETVSSSRLGSDLAINDAQVRKDLAFFGQFGHSGVGYRVVELIPALRGILGIDRTWPTAMIGLGDLGRALVKYKGFRGRGFQVVALFDNDPRKQGSTHGGLKVQPLDDLPTAAATLGITLAILSVPADAAQRVADLAVSAGIMGLLNFAPVSLVVPPSVSLMAVDLSIQLEHLAYKVQNRRGGGISFAG